MILFNKGGYAQARRVGQLALQEILKKEPISDLVGFFPLPPQNLPEGPIPKGTGPWDSPWEGAGKLLPSNMGLPISLLSDETGTVFQFWACGFVPWEALASTIHLSAYTAKIAHALKHQIPPRSLLLPVDKMGLPNGVDIALFVEHGGWAMRMIGDRAPATPSCPFWRKAKIQEHYDITRDEVKISPLLPIIRFDLLAKVQPGMESFVPPPLNKTGKTLPGSIPESSLISYPTEPPNDREGRPTP